MTRGFSLVGGMVVTSCVAAQLTTVSPLRTFDISRCISIAAGPPVTHAFTVTASDLYFLISPPSAPSQHLVVTDLSGNCKRTTSLPEPVHPHSLVVDSGGQVSVLKRNSFKSVERLTLNSTGTPATRIALAEPAFQLISAGTKFVGATPGGDVYLYNQAGEATRKLLSGPVSKGIDPLYLTAASNQWLLLVNGKTGNAHAINSKSGVVTAFSIAPQDIAAARAVYSLADQHKATVITSAASQGDGYVYLSLGGIRLAEGALILKIDLTGNVIQRFRCSLPTRSAYSVPGNPEGFMSPMLIQVRGDILYILDRNGSIAQYAIPR